MLHLLTKAVATGKLSILLSYLCGCKAPSYSLFFPNTAQNQPAIGWFLFQKPKIVEEKMYFMLLCNYALAGNVYLELATCKIA
ncbi:hypothetical protein NUACC26_081220 [Scytonema sp. NUACC26]